MLNIKAEVFGGEHIVAFLTVELRLAGYAYQRDALSYEGERIGNGLSCVGVDGCDDVGTRDIWLAILPHDMVFILEPVFELVRAAIYRNGAPVVTIFSGAAIDCMMRPVVGNMGIR